MICFFIQNSPPSQMPVPLTWFQGLVTSWDTLTGRGHILVLIPDQNAKYHHYCQELICFLGQWNRNLKLRNIKFEYSIDVWRSIWLNTQGGSDPFWLRHGIFQVREFKLLQNLSLTSPSSVPPVFPVTDLTHRMTWHTRETTSHTPWTLMPSAYQCGGQGVQMLRAGSQVHKGLLFYTLYLAL